MGKNAAWYRVPYNYPGGTPWRCYRWTPMGTWVGSDSYLTRICSLFQLDCSCFEISPSLWFTRFLGTFSILVHKRYLTSLYKVPIPAVARSQKSSLPGAKLQRQRCNLTYLKVELLPVLRFHVGHNVLQWVRTVVVLLLHYYQDYPAVKPWWT